MADNTIKLEAIEFTSAPTKTQFENTLNSMEDFLNRMVGKMLAEGEAKATDQFIGQTLNAAIGLRTARDISQGNSGLAIPQQQARPQMVR